MLTQPFQFNSEPHPFAGKFMACYVEASGNVCKIGPFDTKESALSYAEESAEFCRKQHTNMEAAKARTIASQKAYAAKMAKEAVGMLESIQTFKEGKRVALKGHIVSCIMEQVPAERSYYDDSEKYGYRLKVRMVHEDGREFQFQAPRVHFIIAKGILAYGDITGHEDWYRSETACADLEKARNFIPQTLKAGVYPNVKVGNTITIIGTISYLDQRDRTWVLNRVIKIQE